MTRYLRNAVFGIAFASLGAVGALGSQAIARPGGMGAGMGQQLQGRVGALFQDLDLSEKQQEVAKEIRLDLQQEFIRNRSANSDGLEEAIEALQGPQPDAEALHALADARMAAASASAHALIDGLLEFYATLDEAQRAKVLQRLDDQQERRDNARKAMQR